MILLTSIDFYLLRISVGIFLNQILTVPRVCTSDVQDFGASLLVHGPSAWRWQTIPRWCRVLQEKPRSHLTRRTLSGRRNSSVTLDTIVGLDRPPESPQVDVELKR